MCGLHLETAGAHVTPAEIVELLASPTPDLSSRFGTMTKVWTDSTTKITGRFHYVQFRDSKPTIDDLITVAHARMVNFAIPRSRINEAVAEMQANPRVMDPWVLLVTEARDLFIKTRAETGRSGELGEMLLYMLIEWALKAPIVACKMYLKTAQQMPVHGTDGIHLGCEGDNLVLYWGESKLHATLASALDDISSSISTLVSSPEKYNNEIRIIRANLNLDGVDEMGRAALKDYFNPYKPESNKLLHGYACLAGFDSKLYSAVESYSPDVCDDAFRKKYEERIEPACNLIIKKVKAAGLDNYRFTYFLLPFPSVDVARQKFQEKLWGSK